MLRFYRNLGLAWLLAGGVVLVAWGIAHVRVVHKINDARAALKAAGLPTHFSDLQRPPLADMENAAVGFLAAARGLSATAISPSSGKTNWNTTRTPFPLGWWAMAEASAKANEAAFQKAIEAAKRSDSDEGMPFSNGAWAVFNRGPHAVEYRALGRVLLDEGVRRHLIGDDAGSLEILWALGSLANVCYREPTQLELLPAIRIDYWHTQYIPLIASNLSVGDGLKSASLAAVRSEIARLIHDCNVPLALATTGSDLGVADVYEGHFAQHCWLVRPLVQQIACDWLVQARTPLVEMTASATDVFRRKPFRTVPSPGSPLAVADGQVKVAHRTAAVALAVALYRADHAGAFPANLDALVPEYLSAVPADPFSTRGGTLTIFLADGGARPMLAIPGDTPLPLPPAVVPTEHTYELRFNKPPYLIDLNHYADLSPPPQPRPPQTRK